MKKQYLLLILFCISTIANAQFKIHSNGYISVQDTSSTALSPISINYSGISNYYIAYKSSTNGILSWINGNGMYGGRFTTTGTGSKTGIKAETFSSQGSSVGVHGYANASGSAYYACGIEGSLGGTSKGAGIYGTINSFIIPDARYAGFFDGATKVHGNLTVTGTINGITLGNSLLQAPQASAKNLSSLGETIVENLARLDAYSNFLPQPKSYEKIKEQDNIEDPELKELVGKMRESEPEKDIIAEQVHSKRHYALDATQLEEVFPDLIYECEDGTKAINYVEMVPLLVQSINELNARIRQLENDNASLTRATDGPSSVTARQDDTVPFTQAMLYQNTPNPFTAQTEVRFSLPDGTRNASICIFDMTGKMLRQIPVDASQQSVTINGYELQPGIYLYSLVVGGQEVDTKRMILSK